MRVQRSVQIKVTFSCVAFPDVEEKAVALAGPDVQPDVAGAQRYGVGGTDAEGVPGNIVSCQRFRSAEDRTCRPEGNKSRRTPARSTHRTTEQRHLFLSSFHPSGISKEKPGAASNCPRRIIWRLNRSDESTPVQQDFVQSASIDKYLTNPVAGSVCTSIVSGSHLA